MVIVAVITGILAAIGTPSLMGMLQGDRVKQGLDQIQLAIQDTQKQAIRNSRRCEIIIRSNGPDNIEPFTPPPYKTEAHKSQCSAGFDEEEKELPPGVSVTMTDGTETTIRFSFKGNIAGEGKTIVVKPTKGRGEKRCLVVTQGLGIMRTGIYHPTQADNPPKAEYCYKSQQVLDKK